MLTFEDCIKYELIFYGWIVNYFKNMRGKAIEVKNQLNMEVLIYFYELSIWLHNYLHCCQITFVTSFLAGQKSHNNLKYVSVTQISFSYFGFEHRNFREILQILIKYWVAY